MQPLAGPEPTGRAQPIVADVPDRTGSPDSVAEPVTRRCSSERFFTVAARIGTGEARMETPMRTVEVEGVPAPPASGQICGAVTRLPGRRPRAARKRRPSAQTPAALAGRRRRPRSPSARPATPTARPTTVPEADVFVYTGKPTRDVLLDLSGFIVPRTKSHHFAAGQRHRLARFHTRRGEKGQKR